MAQGSTRGVPIDIDSNLSLNSDLVVPSQKAIKTYVDNNLSLKQNSLGYTPVNKAGDTMLGDLYLYSEPVYALQAATKSYVDQQVTAGIQLHSPVRVETTGNLNATYANGGTTPTVTAITGNNTLTSTAHGLSVNDVIVFNTTSNGLTAGTPYFVYSTPTVDTFTLSLTFGGVQITTLTNGTGLSLTSRANSGVGATLTNAGTQAALVIDGVTMSVNDRVMVRLQTNGAQNGVYVVTSIGSGSTNWVLTRSSDANKYAPKDENKLGQGDYFYTTAGTLNAGDSHILNTAGTIVFGTTSLSFAQFSGAITYTGGTNIDVTGQVISLTGQVAVANGGTGAATLTGVLIGNGTSAVTGLTGTASQLLRRNAGNTAYEFFSPSYITLTSLSASTPLGYNNTTGAFTITQSSGSQDGYLSSTDWNTFNNKLTSPMTILGDIIYGGASGAATRLAGNITSAKQYLSQTGTGTVSAAPSWATIDGADITGAALTKTDDTNVTLTLGGTPATSLLRAASLTLGWTGTLAITRGGTGASTKAAAFDALSPLTTIGDTIYFDGTDNVRLAGNTTATKNFLVQTGTGTVSAAPSWGTILGADVPQFTSTLQGTVPASGGGTTNFLRADGTWAAPTGGGTITGSGTANQVTYWSGTSAITGSATFTYTPTSALLVNNSVTAAAAIASGINFTPTLIAAANNDVLVGLDINPTFTNGAFTGVANYGFKLSSGQLNINATSFPTSTIGNSAGRHIIGGTNTPYLILWNETAAAANNISGIYIGAKSATSATNLGGGAVIGGLENATDSAGYLSLRTTIAGGAMTEAVRINTSQNIGIGTITIGSKLQINGNAAIGYSASTAAPTNGLFISGNSGIGITTIRSWSASYKAFEIGNGFGIMANASNYDSYFVSNAFYNGTSWIVSNNASANPVQIAFNSAIYFSTGSTNTIGSASTMTIRMVVLPSGNVVIGNDNTASSPNTGIIRGTNGSGTNISGAEFRVQGGIGTGTGAGGAVTIYTANASGTSGTTLNTATEKFRVAQTGQIKFNSYTTTSSFSGTVVGYLAFDSSGNILSVAPSSGSGTVTDVSVVSANGFAGTVATSTSTPAITISTTVTGLLKGNGTAISAATANTDYLAVNNPTYTGTLGTGTLTYTPANLFLYAQQSQNSYIQAVFQNSNANPQASADIVVNNNLSTDTTYYGDFGINSSGFTGSGSLSLPNAVYLTATTGDLVLGTTTSNAVRFVTNSSTTDSLVLKTTNQIQLPSYTTTSSFVGTLVGYLGFDSSGNIITTAAPSAGYTVTNQTTTYTATATSGTLIIKCDTTGGAFTVNLPTAVGNTATIIIKKTAGSGAVTVDGNASETIDGGLTATINKVYESITLISDNSNWQIV